MIEERPSYNKVGKLNNELLDARETARIDGYISDLKLYSNNAQMLTNIYTEILNDENVVFMITKISQDSIFMEHFPEFYEQNEFGENVINCQQNSKYHKYGVFRHILYTIEAVGNPKIPIGDWQKKLLKWTMFLHDIGKPYVKITDEDGMESFAGHDDKSVELAVEILNRFDFTEEEKHIILTLIKYHDRYLNEGEITYDNLRFLASELDDKKDLFYLLLDVKDADAKSKGIEVYNRYKVVRTKYMEFANKFFERVEINVNEGIINDASISNPAEENVLHYELIKSKENSVNENSPAEEVIMQKADYDSLIEQVIQRKKVGVLYQPIIDVHTSSVQGYETYTKIEEDKKINIAKFLKYAEDTNKYDKLQQSLFINAADSFEGITNKEANSVFINIDIDSYESYVNKPRMYDMMQRMEVTLELHNYEKYDYSTLQEKIDPIRSKKGKVLLDHFGIGIMGIDDLRMLEVDYVKPDITVIQNIEKSAEKQKYISELLNFCVSKDINLVVVGVETKEQFEVLNNIGVRYMQGYLFSYPAYRIDMVGDKLYNIISNKANDSII